MRRYHLYVTAICAAAILGTSGCASQTQAAESTAAVETTAAETTVVESVTGPIESMEEEPVQTPQAVRIYGPVTRLENGSFSIDNQSGASMSGEIILNIDEENSLVLDAVSGLPAKTEDIKDGDTVYAYIGPAMTMSLPPMTNVTVMFTGIPADFKVPDYVEIKSVITDAETSQTVLTAADGTTYSLAEDCTIIPYLTRNIVTLDDLTEGKKVVIWSNDENTAEKIMVFAD